MMVAPTTVIGATRWRRKGRKRTAPTTKAPKGICCRRRRCSISHHWRASLAHDDTLLPQRAPLAAFARPPRDATQDAGNSRASAQHPPAPAAARAGNQGGGIDYLAGIGPQPVRPVIFLPALQTLTIIIS